MVSEKETTSIRRFVSAQLRGEPDLSTLTLGILKKRYLAQVGCDSLSPEARNYMKQVAQEELMKMQDDANRSELEAKKSQNKRKREKENDEAISGSEGEARSKKSRCQSSSSSELEDKEHCKTRSEESEDGERSGSEDGEQEVKRTQPKTNGKSKQQVTSEDSTDEEKSESEQKGNESNCGGSTNGVKRTSNTIQEKETPQSESETDKDSKSDKIDGNESSDDSEKEKVSTEKKNDEPDSDSSSLPSLEDEQKSEADNKKKKTLKKDESTRGQKDDDKALVRLKRYIALCGVRRNYKKLLDGCRSVRSKVAVLKKELEDLGVHGQPSIEKCKKIRMKREEAQELAELDVSNIIATQGRPKRTGASGWQEQCDPPSSTYQRTLDSGSDTDEENDTYRGRRRATDWANLQGIISDDADSD